ncbi:hypothetical protein D1007_32814 [Hordeum vulgare]|nr:hypothetical protein D1007_32814 [Hordeum vulgare]
MRGTPRSRGSRSLCPAKHASSPGMPPTTSPCGRLTSSAATKSSWRPPTALRSIRGAPQLRRSRQWWGVPGTRSTPSSSTSREAMSRSWSTRRCLSRSRAGAGYQGAWWRRRRPLAPVPSVRQRRPSPSSPSHKRRRFADTVAVATSS